MGPMLSMNGCGECEIEGGGGIIWERQVLKRWRTKAGLRRMAGRR